jgi:hypothetical protein
MKFEHPSPQQFFPKRRAESSQIGHKASTKHNIPNRLPKLNRQRLHLILPPLFLPRQAIRQLHRSLYLRLAFPNLCLQCVFLGCLLFQSFAEHVAFLDHGFEDCLFLVELVFGLLDLALGLGEVCSQGLYVFVHEVVFVHGFDPFEQPQTGQRRFFNSLYSQRLMFLKEISNPLNNLFRNLSNLISLNLLNKLSRITQLFLYDQPNCILIASFFRLFNWFAEHVKHAFHGEPDWGSWMTICFHLDEVFHLEGFEGFDGLLEHWKGLLETLLAGFVYGLGFVCLYFYCLLLLLDLLGLFLDLRIISLHDLKSLLSSLTFLCQKRLNLFQLLLQLINNLRTPIKLHNPLNILLPLARNPLSLSFLHPGKAGQQFPESQRRDIIVQPCLVVVGGDCGLYGLVELDEAGAYFGVGWGRQVGEVPGLGLLQSRFAPWEEPDEGGAGYQAWEVADFHGQGISHRRYYIDDMEVRSRSLYEHLPDLQVIQRYLRFLLDIHYQHVFLVGIEEVGNLARVQQIIEVL